MKTEDKQPSHFDSSKFVRPGSIGVNAIDHRKKMPTLIFKEVSRCQPNK